MALACRVTGNFAMMAVIAHTVVWGGWPKHSSPEREDEIGGERGRLGSKKWTLLCGSDLDLHRGGNGQRGSKHGPFCVLVACIAELPRLSSPYL